MRTKACKHCSSDLHTSLKCFKAPRKAIRRSVTASKPKKVKRSRSKTLSRSQLVKRLDSIYSQYIRLKNADNEGYCICVTCGDRIHWKEIQNGHFISRAKYPTRWHDENCHPQCMRDNIFLNGRYIDYTLYMIERYGIDKVKELKQLSVSPMKISTPDLRDRIEHYKAEVKKLA